jgi:hypothetical protein
VFGVDLFFLKRKCGFVKAFTIRNRNIIYLAVKRCQLYGLFDNLLRSFGILLGWRGIKAGLHLMWVNFVAVSVAFVRQYGVLQLLLANVGFFIRFGYFKTSTIEQFQI